MLLEQCYRCFVSVPMSERWDEVEAAVDSVVLNVSSVQPALVSEELFKLLVDVVFYVPPADAETENEWVKPGGTLSMWAMKSRATYVLLKPQVQFKCHRNTKVLLELSWFDCEEEFMTSPFCVVDGVSEPWRVYDGQPQFDSFLLNANGVFDDGDCSTDPLCKRTQFVQRCMRSHMCHQFVCLPPPYRKWKTNAYLQHWELFCPCKDPWGTNCWLVWIYRGRTPLQRSLSKVLNHLS